MTNRLTIDEIYGENFNSLGKFELKIKPGKHLVIGKTVGATSTDSNGSGKSSIFESPLWTVYKLSLRESDPSRDQKGNCMTGVRGTVNGNSYNIFRYLRMGKLKNTSVLEINGEDISQRLSTSTDEEILKIFTISPDLFMSTIIVTQGFKVNLVGMTPTVRKVLLEESVGFQVWESYRASVKKPLDAFSSKRHLSESEYRSKNDVMVAISTKLEAIKTMSANRAEELKKLIDAEQAFLDTQRASIADLTHTKISLVGAATTRQLRDEFYSVQNKTSQLRRQLDDYGHALVNGKCPTCSQSYPPEMVQQFRNAVDSLTNQIQSLTQDSEFKNKMASKIELIDTRLSELANTIRNRQPGLEHAIRELTTLSTGTGTEEVEAAYAKARLDSENAKSELQSINDEIENLSFINSELLPSSKFRSNILDRYLAYINQIMDQIQPLLFTDLKISMAIDKKGTGIEFLMSKNGKETSVKKLSGGERRRIDILVTFAIQRFLINCSGLSTNLLVFDEIFDGIEPSGFDAILNAIDNLFPETSAIYIISHNNSIKSRFDSIIRVVKENDVSTIQGEL